MKIILLSSFLIQGAVMFIDEFYFHRKRGLPPWEKLGHPLDSLSVIACYIFLWFSEYNELNLKLYAALAVFSCLLITKDEFVHKEVCSAFENWLHALLFVVHPIPFFAAGLLWSQTFDKSYFGLMAALVAVLFLYQIVFWSFYEKDRS